MQDIPEPKHSAWIVLNVNTHREEYALKNLERQKYSVYCPMQIKRIKHARQTYDARRPFFPGYIFVERSEPSQRWRPILGTVGVRSVLRDGEGPAILPRGFVESLKAREVDGAIGKAAAPLEPGQTITIDGGVFDGFIGEILELQDRDRVLVLLNLLNQQTKVRVDAKMLHSA